MKTKRWVFADSGDASAELLQKNGYAPLVAKVLASRGIKSFEQAEKYLGRGIEALHDPFLLADMEKAVGIIRNAIQEKEHILIYGDYDVDGITATCIMVDYLRSKGVSCDYYIPNRLSEGYGLTCEAINRLKEQGVDLLVTVDSGVTANEEIAEARRLGMRVVVTDHHECHGELPAANALVDPKRADCGYPFDCLAGVGVAFKLLCALEGDTKTVLERYSELIALGTVADVMPIIGENRVIVSEGLERMPHTGNLGLEMLLRESGMKSRRLNSSTVSYILAPRINAAGRMGHAELASELFLTKDAYRAQELAIRLCENNRLRQEEENQILEQALKKLSEVYNPLEDKIIVLSGEGWHHGVLGIVCSRICDRYGCPVVLIAIDEAGMGKGSGRSVKGFNLFDALTSCEELLDRYGGHELAAGLTVKAEHVEELSRRLHEYANKKIRMSELMLKLHIDCMAEPSDVTMENIRALSILEPYGMKNAEPVFCMEGMTAADITPISSDRHVRMSLIKDGVRWPAIWFGVGAGELGFVEGSTVDAAFHLEVNEYRGKSSVQLTICDVRLSECEHLADQKLLNIYNTYIGDGPLTAKQARILLPDRADLVAVWRHISFKAKNSRLSVPDGALSRRVSWESGRDLNIGKLFVCLDVFSESKLISYHFKEGMLNILLKPFKGKADISKSVVLATLQSMAG